MLLLTGRYVATCLRQKHYGAADNVGKTEIFEVEVVTKVVTFLEVVVTFSFLNFEFRFWIAEMEFKPLINTDKHGLTGGN